MKISESRKYHFDAMGSFEGSFATSPDTFLYFAYGSNLNPEQIRRRIPEARAVGRATLRGWKLVERLYADIERSRGSRVEGVLYLVTKTELHRLDLYEGYPSVYGHRPRRADGKPRDPLPRSRVHLRDDARDAEAPRRQALPRRLPHHLRDWREVLGAA